MHMKLDSATSSTSGLMVILSQITPYALYTVMVSLLKLGAGISSIPEISYTKPQYGIYMAF